MVTHECDECGGECDGTLMCERCGITLCGSCDTMQFGATSCGACTADAEEEEEADHACTECGEEDSETINGNDACLMCWLADRVRSYRENPTDVMRVLVAREIMHNVPAAPSMGDVDGRAIEAVIVGVLDAFGLPQRAGDGMVAVNTRNGPKVLKLPAELLTEAYRQRSMDWAVDRMGNKKPGES